MERFYVTILFFLLTITHVCGQEIKKHTVQRGETLESIAKDYNLSPTELRNANFDMEVLYTGLEIDVPIKKITVASNGTQPSSNSDAQYLKTLTEYLNDCEIADNLFEARNYSKAQKQYKQTIQKYKDILPCEDALYGNALCSYNREKWKSAIEDLTIVINNEDCSQGQRDHCKRLLAKAQSYRDQQLENRSNFWGGLFMTAASVGVAYMNAKSEIKSSLETSVSKMQNNHIPTPTFNFQNVGSPGSDIKFDFSNVNPIPSVPYTEGIPTPTFNFQNIGSPGSDIKFDFSNVSPIPSVPYTEGVSFESVNSPNQMNSTTGTSSNGKTCHLCHGYKKCWTCSGNRTFINPLTNKRIACPNCTDGRCSRCNGTGKI